MKYQNGLQRKLLPGYKPQYPLFHIIQRASDSGSDGRSQGARYAFTCARAMVGTLTWYQAKVFELLDITSLQATKAAGRCISHMDDSVSGVSVDCQDGVLI